MSTSKLQRYTAIALKINIPHLDVLENHRPDWLQNPNGSLLELDFYIPNLKVAIEIQGRQHYEFSPFFHKSYDEFLAQQERDEVKRITCSIEGVKLFELDTQAGVDELIVNLYLTEGHFLVDPPLRKQTSVDKKAIKKIKRKIAKAEQSLSFIKSKLQRDINQEKRDNLKRNQFGHAKNLYELNEKLKQFKSDC